MLRQTVAEEEALCKDGNKENKVKKFLQTGSHHEVLVFLSFAVVLLLVSSLFILYKLVFCEHAYSFLMQSYFIIY